LTRPRGNIFRVAGLCGVKLLRPQQRYAGPLRPRDCFARATVRKICRRHGEGHLALCFRLCVETQGNAGELYAETLLGISALLTKHPSLLDRGTALFDAFDEISLAEARRLGTALAIGQRVHEAIAVILALWLFKSETKDQEERKRAS